MRKKETAFLLLLCLMSCERKLSLPTAPTPTSGLGGIGGYVMSSKGPCIIEARVEVLDGSHAGAAVVQKDCPFGDAYGYRFDDLPLNEQVTIRASAAGYKPAQIRMFTTLWVPQTNFALEEE